VPDRALAVYGTLAPGEPNHHVVADIGGRWVEGAVRGHRFEARWRGMPGYPGFLPDAGGPVVEVLVLVSALLGEHWGRLDDFEGPGYRRREVEVFDRLGAGSLGQAFIYETLVEALG
jgi:gamma-glutamylcyclotransferase (GGCT)/AIG2-like uncharacterized protein YtfP